MYNLIKKEMLLIRKFQNLQIKGFYLFLEKILMFFVYNID